ncbi:inter-alpha-trypsin inhibitor heavy chain H4-like isoform X3 [Aricia agestis]|uniref:inter-alpha-trypsin inhibitor heavy chain H4-like isoform X3 n=1 Tax=Aricia agestis TaxID=91739 RepID=UPI001C201957|nr:inter-alpha-trypsin inhibitor heavy chain H4-like isoform X3 [Aricia agestis]
MRFGSTALCLALLVAAAYPAAVPTQETMVVARSDDAQTTNAESSSPAPTTEATTEASVPIKLTKMHVTSEIALRYARTAVVTYIRNPAKRAQEATFRVLLPETAFISGFVMTLDGKQYKAYVKEKEEAKQIYNDAVSQGFGAAHVAAKARDSNHFTVSVNVEPNSAAIFNLTYEELLVRRNGVYNHAINLHPGALVPDMKVTVHIKESQKLSQLRVPEVRTGNEVDATDEDAQNSLAVIEKGNKDKEATITFTPDVNEQKRLMEIYAAKTKESQAHQTRWYGDEEENDKEGMLGQFIVQYDVDRSKSGEVLVNDGYFVHFLAPTSLPPLRKHVVFVLDTSGSMMGRKVDQLRDAMKTILGKLNPGDYFNIVEFDSSVEVHDLKEADEPEKKPTFSYYDSPQKPLKLLAPSLATPENIEKAQIIVSRLQASGGTNIYSALDVALDLIRFGKEGPPKTVTPSPDQPHAEPEVQTTVEPATETVVLQESAPKVAEETSVAVDEPVDETAEQLEPIVIFLTDGDPTVGVTDTTRIISHLSEKNSGRRRAAIFSLAFGEDADRKFLRKLSLRNEGFMRHIYEAADAALQLRDFYRQVSSPLLADVKFIYPAEQIKEGSLTKHKFRTVYDGSEAVVAGRVADGVIDFTPEVSGFCGVDDGFARKKYQLPAKVPVSKVKSEYLPLERLWAYLTVKQLLDEKDASDADQKTENSPENKALKIALQYEFVTSLTSLVVVKPNATKAVDAESVDDNASPYNRPAWSAGYIQPLSGGGGSVAAFGLSGVPAPQYSFASQSYGGPLQVQDSAPAMFESEDVADSVPKRAYAHHAYHTSSLHSNFRNDVVAYPSVFRAPFVPNSSHYDSFIAPSSTPALPTTQLATTERPNRLAEYHLEECSWAEEFLNSTLDALLLNVNGTQVTLKLSKDDAPKRPEGDASCGRATDGAAGACVYVTRCAAARDIAAAQYQDLYCTVNEGFAGICCPTDKIDVISKTN